MTDETVLVPLPSLIHRLGGERVKQLKYVASQYDCTLNRVRRSRHWQVTGTVSSLTQFLDVLKSLEEESLRSVIKQIESILVSSSLPLESMEARLIKIIDTHPSITLNELMQKTSCSLAQARRARFESDIL
ncbi:ribosome recycling factor family protein [Vibrio genomosp. F10]|uniref:ribosome recycling factor family protein n=1 Tax=Vibrio genomosp. F10 TaxID=723171 RepID=UPI0002D961A0|nr:ribosome recycling factor family protein [Vibrio genomosp. F10]OEF05304.1 ribosome recycling factor [Vibrio genomosp. F10 str. 9ZB36]